MYIKPTNRFFMTKGEQTKNRILERSAALFNRFGYNATSFGDIMADTGLEKGGIYNHFASKEALMLEAFEYAAQRLNQRYQHALEGKSAAVERLTAVLAVFEATITDPPMRGGCPLLNAATESDDALPALRARVRRAINGWLTVIVGVVERGQLDGQLRRDVDAASTASVIFSALEGAVMLSRLYRDPTHIHSVVAFLKVYLLSLKQTDRF